MLEIFVSSKPRYDLSRKAVPIPTHVGFSVGSLRSVHVRVTFIIINYVCIPRQLPATRV